MYYERGATSRRASIETGILLSEVRDQFRRFHRLGIKRLGRHFMLPEWRSAAAYTGPDWIGVAVARTVPMKAGPDWIGERAHSTTVRRPLH
jgi:hypothetical protein